MSSAVQQGSLGSSGSSILVPTPRWNFHGLIDPDAETQSQYFNDDFECIESQKENIAVDEVMQEPEEDPITINEPNPLSGLSTSPTMARASNLHNAPPPRKTRPAPSHANALEPASQDSFLNTFPDRPPPGYIKPFSNNNTTVSQIRGDHDDSGQRRRIPAPDSEPDDAEPKAASDNGSQVPDDEEGEEEISSAQARDELPPSDCYASDAPRPTSQPVPRASQLSEADSTQPASTTSVQPYITHDIQLRQLIIMTINNYGESARHAWCQKLSESGISYEDAWRIRTSDYMRALSEVPSDGIIVVDSASQTFDEDGDEECEATQPNPGSNAVESEPYEATQPNPGSNGVDSHEETQPDESNEVDSFDPSPQIAGSDVEDSYEETQQIAGSNIVESPIIPPRALEVLPQVTSQPDSSIVPETVASVDVDMEDKMPLAQLIKLKPPSKPRPPSRQTQQSPALPANTSITSDDVVPDSLELTQEPVPSKKAAQEAPAPAEAGPSKPNSKAASTPKPPPKSKPTPKPKPKTTPRVAATPASARKRKRADSDASPVVKEEEQAEGTKRAVRPKKRATPAARRQPARGRKGKQRERQDTEALSGDDEDPLAIKREPGSAVLDTETPKVKRQRVNSGSLLRRKQAVELPEPVRVFAKTKAGEWWPANVTGRTSTGFSVDFDDATSCVVGLQDLRAFQLRVNDEGFIDVGETMRFFAISRGESADAEEVAVVFSDDEEEVLPVGSIRFLGKYVKTNWEERRLTDDLKAVGPAGRTTRAVKRDGLFAEYTFLPTGFPDGHHDVDALKRAGGSVLKKWEQVFNFNKNGDSLRGDAVTLWDGANIGRIFLLSQDARPTPKYLIAIALGVPCVNIGWALDSIKAGRVLGWAPYLLPAGKAYHNERNLQVSQYVNLEWDQEDTATVWTNPVSRKPFDGKRVLCVGPAYMSGNMQTTGEIPYIILAMGAKRVDVLKTVSDKKALKQYDYILQDNKGLVVVPQDPAYTVFDQEQLKSSLFLGRLTF